MESLGQGISDAAFHFAWSRVAVSGMEIVALFVGLWLVVKAAKWVFMAMVADEKPKS